MPICLKVRNTSETVWMNPHTSSPKHCIPTIIKYAKETKELTIITTNGVYIVTTEIKLTIVDGKVCTALSDSLLSSICYICKATPTEINNLESVKQKKKIVSNFEIGFSTLHVWIKFIKRILYIAYRLEIRRNWRIAKKEDKETMQKTKKRIYITFP